MTRAVEALINLRALSHNLQCVRENAPDSQLLAVIKANAYGHGLLRVAHALRDADAFAVASLDEALVLREAGVKHRIVLLEGVFDCDELLLASQQGLTIVVHHAMQLQMLETYQLVSPLDVWLKIDTGMHRLGFAPEQVQSCYQRLEQCKSVATPICLLTHLANADDRQDDLTPRQVECFHDAVEGLNAEHSIANSAGILAWPQTHFNEHSSWVRPGIMLYGVSPFVDSLGEEHKLQAVMTLRSRLIAVSHRKAGETLGYGASWRCPIDMPVGVVAVGYGDGYPYHAPSGTPMLVNGQCAPLVGRVSMDMICVDLRGCDNAEIGSEVVLWGDGLPVEEVARAAGTIPYELLCGITARVPMIEC